MEIDWILVVITKIQVMRNYPCKQYLKSIALNYTKYLKNNLITVLFYSCKETFFQ